MHISAHLDVDVVAHETEDQLSVLVDLTAPPAPDNAAQRSVSTLEVVLDRSGSMSGGRLEGAKAALVGLVDRLAPTDNFGLIAFDSVVEVVSSAGPLTDKPAVKRAIAAVDARGSTDLSAGYLRGLQETRRVAGPAGATVLLISDGHANAGITEPDTLAGIAAEAHGHGVRTSTLGFGLGYDERIMSAAARGGAGNELFAEEADTAGKLIASEVDGLLAQTAQAASLLIRMSPQVRAVQVLNEGSTTTTSDGVLAELGSFYAEETRKLLLVFDIPAIPVLGLAEVATLEFSYVELPAVKEHTVTVALQVNVVPGDQAAGRVADPVVRTERAYLLAQQAKRRASTHLTAGDGDAALREIRDAQATIGQALLCAPAALVDDLSNEVDALAHLAHETQYGTAARAAKYSSMDAAHKSRTRGRRPPSP